MAQVTFLDKLLHEYLVFRGFSNTIKALDNEQRNEKDQSFRAEKIMEQFNQHIQTHDLNSLLTLWKHLDTHLFSKLEHSYAMGKYIWSAIILWAYIIKKKKIFFVGHTQFLTENLIKRNLLL